MKTENLLKRLVKDQHVVFVGTAEQCARTLDELFELAREKGLSPGRQGSVLRLFEARAGKDSIAAATIECAEIPAGRAPKVFRLKPAEWPVVVGQDQSVVLADE